MASLFGKLLSLSALALLAILALHFFWRLRYLVYQLTDCALMLDTAEAMAATSSLLSSYSHLARLCIQLYAIQAIAVFPPYLLVDVHQLLKVKVHISDQIFNQFKVRFCATSLIVNTHPRTHAHTCAHTHIIICIHTHVGTCTHTHTHTHIMQHIHTCMHAHTHTHIRTHKHTHNTTHTHVRVHTHTYAQTHTHTHIIICIHTHVGTCTQTHTCTHECMDTHAHTHTHTHTHKNTHTHTKTHTHTHTHNSKDRIDNIDSIDTQLYLPQDLFLLVLFTAPALGGLDDS